MKIPESESKAFITARWQHELQVCNGSLFSKCHGTDRERLRCMQLTTMTSSLLCPKLKGSWYSGHYTIIRKFSANVGQVSHPVHTGFVSQLKCPEFRKHRVHKRRQTASKCVQPLLQKETLSLLSCRQTNLPFASERNTIFTFQSCLPDKHT